MDKILTITIPAYNVEKYLDNTLSTILDEQILDEIEILIVNDGSNDKTKDIGRQYEKRYPQSIQLVNKKNGGHGSAINKGIELATGRYFKLIDGDDWVDTKKFVKFVKALKNVESDVVAIPYVCVNDITKEQEIKMFSNVELGKKYQADDILNNISDQYAMHALTFRTSILKQIPEIREHCFYVDMEYILYPLKYIQTVTFLDMSVYQYRVGNNEQSVSIKSKQKNREMHKFVINDLIDFYKNESLSTEKHIFLSNKIKELIGVQIRIYLSFRPSAEIKKELKDFCSVMNEKIPKLYVNAPGKLCKILYLSNHRLYGLLALYHSLKCRWGG